MVACASTPSIPVCRAPPHSRPSGCLLRANCSPLPGPALQTPHFSTPSPCLQQGHPLRLGVGMAGVSTPCTGLTLSCCHTLAATFSSPDVESTLLFLLPSGLQVPSLPLSSSFSFFFFDLPGSAGILLCPFTCPRSSASFLQRLCENCSICRCGSDEFVKRDQLHVCLILCHLGPSSLFYFQSS